MYKFIFVLLVGSTGCHDLANSPGKEFSLGRISGSTGDV